MDATLEKKLAALEAITNLHRSVGANLELEKIGEILVSELQRILRCDGCAIMLVGESNVSMLAECGFSRAMGRRDFSTATPAVQYILQTRGSILTGNVHDSPAAGCVPLGCSMQSLICAPVVVGGEVRGIIHLDSPKRDAFDEDDLAFVQLLCSELSFVFERSLAYSRVRQLSVNDGLTGLRNRRAFDDDLSAAIEDARAKGYPVSLVMIDVDWFKAYNDCHGHPRGDCILSQLGGVLRGNVRATDGVYRYGGEEFAVMLRRTGKRLGGLVARRLHRTVEATHFDGARVSQPNERLTISAGVAEYPSDAHDAQQLLLAADAALYSAKRAGRNRVYLCDSVDDRVVATV